MRLRDFLQPSLVFLDLEAEGAEGAIRALVDRFRDRGVIEDPAAVEEALISREAVHTTAMGCGVAVPHATIPGLERPVVAIAVAPRGIEFGPVGLDPVRVFFVLLSPIHQRGLHIKLLARIARLVRHPGLIGTLPGASSAGALLAELERVDAEHV